MLFVYFYAIFMLLLCFKKMPQTRKKLKKDTLRNIPKKFKKKKPLKNILDLK